MSEHIVLVWVGKLLALFAEHLFQNQAKSSTVLGGHGVVVEVDESKFGEEEIQQRIQKRSKLGTWLGGETDKKQMFLHSAPWQ